MKTVSIIYRNRENFAAIEYVSDCLYRIFEDEIQVRLHFIDEIPKGTLLEGDVFMIHSEVMLYHIKPYVPNYNNVILMTRSVNRRYMSVIMEIPAETNVLVVNDTDESTIQITYNLYELGVGHLNLIPYEERLDKNGYYDHVNMAITADEVHRVPKYIKKVLNIGSREIGFDTLLKIMRKLNLDDNSRINRNLVRHIDTVVETNADFHANYLDNYLKSQMIDQITHDPSTAILLTNDQFQLVYVNERADAILRLGDGGPKDLPALLGDEAFQVLAGDEMAGSYIRIGEESYLWEKQPIRLMDRLMGYHIRLKDEKNVRDMELSLNKHLLEKGCYARYHFYNIVHQSQAMKQCIETAKKAARTDYTILIQGDSGTGKELLAQSIHNASNRAKAPFVAINCAALPESLLESELFGYESGAFTGAHKNGKLGLFEQAHTGTIFLDEIGDISPNLQSRLLRTIQEKQIMRIGSDRVINVDIRIIAATNRDLFKEIQEGSFRKDLYYRLNVIPVPVPPLRERREDILPLFHHFLGREFSSVSEHEKSRLISYSWPGNVREVESIASYYKTLSAIPAHIRGEADEAGVTLLSGSSAAADSVHCEHHAPFGHSVLPQGSTVQNLQSQVPVAQTSQPLRSLESEILRLIGEASQPYHGLGRNALWQKLKAEGIHISDGKLRQLLKGLQDQGRITIGAGRAGMRLVRGDLHR